MPTGVFERTEAHKRKISEALKGRMPSFIPDNKGRERTREHRRKISETLKAKGIKPPSRKGIRNPDALRYQPGYRAHMEKRRKLRKQGNGGSHTYAEWLALKRHYGNSCAHCGRTEPEVRLTVDHILPISKGGPDSIQNIQPLCLKCNMAKGSSVPAYASFMLKQVVP